MTPLVLTLTLTTPAQPPLFRPPASPAPSVAPTRVAPNIRTLPHVSGSPYRQPGIGPGPLLPAAPVYPVVPGPEILPIQPPAPVVPAALTLAEFSRFFTPTPGLHRVWLIHPVTQQPVQVCFTLPNGQLREFRVDRRSIRFEFSCGDVEIDFRSNGTVRIDYDR
ncbi:MAG: hypothetical protein RMJ56_14000 [Gemmataceae bacterium]|nr:hypothetical protein [Gemmata sp.]MDW8198705.1 hypothetical protein [Gemmataceae bacterium]